MRIFLLFQFFLMIAFLRANQMPSQAFSSMQITILQPNNSAFATDVSPNHRFSFTLDSPPAGVNRAFCALSGYHIVSNISFDFFTNLIYTSPTNVVLEFNSYGDLIVYRMSFCIISTTPLAYPYLAVEDYGTLLSINIIKPQVISDSNRTLNFSQTVEYATLNSSLLFTHTNFRVFPWISYVKCRNSYTGIIVVLNNTVVGSCNFVLQMSLHAGVQVTTLKVVVIALDLTLIYTLSKLYFFTIASARYNYGAFSNIYLVSTMTPSYFPAIYGPIFSRNCSLALYTTLNGNNGLEKKIMFNYSTPSGFTDIQEGGHGLVAQFYTFCTIDCLLEGFYNIYSGNCQMCDTYVKHCQRCINSTYCISCGLNTYFDPLFKKCHCNGYWVIGGCTQIQYCVEIDPNLADGKCKRCGNNFTLSINGDSCDCLMGNRGMGGFCINIPGCITAVQAKGKVQCLSCSLKFNFLFPYNNICLCMNGFTQRGGICIPFCGDGLVYLYEACDDGNTQDGDGCSSQCIIEKYYACKNGSNTHKSDCYYANLNIKLNKIRISKDAQNNIGIFVFSFTPSPFILNKINFTSSTTFTTTPKHQIQYISFSGSQLFISTEYYKDLEGETATLGLLLDRRIILKNSFNLSFIIKSSNYPLIISKNKDQLGNQRLTMKVLAGFTLLLFILGSWSHQMIGVQTLIVYLLVYFTLGIDEVGNQIVFSPLTQLKYLSNYGDIFEEQIGNQASNRLKLRSMYIENNFIILPLFLFTLLILGGIAMHHKFNSTSKKDKYFEVYAFSLLFYLFSLPFALGYFSYTFITATLSIYGAHYHSFLHDTVLVMIGIGSTALIISLECARGLSNSNSQKKGVYFLIFTANTLFFATFLILSWHYSFCIYLLQIESVLYLLFLVLYRPYYQKLHLFSIIENQITIVSWVGIIIFMKITDVSQATKSIFMSGIIFLLILVDIMATIRIIYQLYCFEPQKQTIWRLIANYGQTNQKQNIVKKDETNAFLLYDNLKRQFIQSQSKNANTFNNNNKEKYEAINTDIALNERVTFANDRHNKKYFIKKRAKLRQILLKQEKQKLNQKQ